MSEYETPDFLLNRSTDDFYEKIKAILPKDLDLSMGGHAWNMSRPIALVAAEICEFILPEVIRLIIPSYSYGNFLNAHAEGRGLSRKPATKAPGEITITGKPDTVIPMGSGFSTPAVNDEPSVEYVTVEEAVIPAGGSIKVKIECTEAGTVGNTTANTIVLVSGRLTGITSVTNELDITGGTDAEDDESLRARIEEYDKSQGDSFVGNVVDYKRWAKSVSGVGDVNVIPATDDTGIVTIIVTDENGDPATDDLLAAVFDKIMSPNNDEERLAPINAILNVKAPDTLAIGIRATIELDTGATLESVSEKFLAALKAQLPSYIEQGEVKFKDVAAVLAGIEGAYDYTNLLIGVKRDGAIEIGTDNIPINDSQLPTISAEDLILIPDTV